MSDKVRLESDKMSNAQLAAMSGAVETWKLGEPKTWNEYKLLPPDLKAEYLKMLKEKYGATNGKIAEMLGIHQTTVADEYKRVGLEKYTGNRNARMSENQIRRWEGFLSMKQIERAKEKPRTSSVAALRETAVPPSPEGEGRTEIRKEPRIEIQLSGGKELIRRLQTLMIALEGTGAEITIEAEA